MARLAATAVLLLSILAVASCRVLEAEPETAAVIFDEQGQVDVDPAVPQEAEAAQAIPSVPTVTVAEGILQLPSQRRPCRHGFLHRHLRWARHHGLSHRRGEFAGPGEARVHSVVLPEEPREVKLELEAVAEPDPDTRPDTDGEEKPFHGEQEVEGEENESVKAWKGEMLRRFRGHGLRFHHRHHHHEQAMAMEKDDGEHQEQQDKAEGVAGMHAKHFSRQFQHHHNGDHEEQEDREEGAGDLQLQHVKMFSRHFHHHHHHGDKEQEQQDKGRRRGARARRAGQSPLSPSPRRRGAGRDGEQALLPPPPRQRQRGRRSRRAGQEAEQGDQQEEFQPRRHAPPPPPPPPRGGGRCAEVVQGPPEHDQVLGCTSPEAG